MKALVSVKRVIDPYVKIRIKPDNSGVETQNVKMSINPFDEIALEEAIRWREQAKIAEVIAVSVGLDASQDVLRHALALGADRAILVRTERDLCSLNVAKVLKKIVDDEQPDIVIMGKQSIDKDNNQTPQMLAALLDWPQATYASSIQIKDDKWEVTREIDGGLETLSLTLPAVISTDLRLNEPRYASLPNIMKAKRKTIEILELDSLQLDLKEHLVIESTVAPANRIAGVKVDSVASLLDKLHNEAKVL